MSPSPPDSAAELSAVGVRLLGQREGVRMGQVTHKNIDGRLVQIVSAERLREILDESGDDYSRPKDFGPDDGWDVGEDDSQDGDE